MYTFEQKNEIIIRLAGSEHFEKDKQLFFKHCSNPRLERDIQRANQFTFKNVDARILNELLNHISQETIIANRNGSSKSGKQDKKPAAKKKPNQTKPSKGASTKKPEVKNLSTTASVATTPDKKKEVNKTNSQE